MAAALQVVLLALLHMQPVQRCLFSLGLCQQRDHSCLPRETMLTACCSATWVGTRPPGTDAMAHQWSQGLLYTFPPFSLLPNLLQRIGQEEVHVILVAPDWAHMTWFSWVTPLLDGTPWKLPVRRDLLSQAQGTLFYPFPQGLNVWAWPLGGPVYLTWASRARWFRPCRMLDPIDEGGILLPLGAVCIMVRHQPDRRRDMFGPRGAWVPTGAPGSWEVTIDPEGCGGSHQGLSCGRG